jgi:hypothetical protein
MKIKLIVSLVLGLLLLIGIVPVLADGSLATVTTTDKMSATTLSCQRDSFYTEGRHWVFFVDDTGYKYSSSTDGVNWDSPTKVLDNGECEEGSHVSLHFDGTRVHYVHAFFSTNHPISYRVGIPNEEGIIFWVAEEQTVVEGIPEQIYGNPTITVDSTGCPWIGYFEKETKRAFVTKSYTSDGFWNTAYNLPYMLEDIDSSTMIIVPLESGKVYAIYYTVEGLKGTSWNGANWSSSEVITSPISDPCKFSAVAKGDNIYLTYLSDYPRSLKFMERVGSLQKAGSWSTELTLDDGENHAFCYPSISLLKEDDLLITYTNNPVNNHIYYLKRVQGLWNSLATDWIFEADDIVLGSMSTYYQENNGVVGIVYSTGNNNPYTIKYKYLGEPTTTPASTSSFPVTTVVLGVVMVLFIILSVIFIKRRRERED